MSEDELACLVPNSVVKLTANPEYRMIYRIIEIVDGCDEDCGPDHTCARASVVESHWGNIKRPIGEEVYIHGLEFNNWSLEWYPDAVVDGAW